MLRIYIVFPLYINILPSTPLCIVKHVYNIFYKCHSNSWHQLHSHYFKSTVSSQRQNTLLQAQTPKLTLTTTTRANSNGVAKQQ